MALSLLDDLVGAKQQRLRNGQAQGLGGLEVDDELELGRLLDREIGRLGALEDLVDVDRRPAPHVRQRDGIAHETARFYEAAKDEHAWYAVALCKGRDSHPVLEKHGIGKNLQSAASRLGDRRF